MFRIRGLLVVLVMVLITGSLVNSVSVFGAAAGTYKISGYVEPDFKITDPMIKAGFKVEIVGTSYYDVTDSTGYFEILNIPIATSINIKVRFSKDGYLKKEISDLKIGSEVLIGTKEEPVKLWPGDLLPDDAINFIDVIQMAKSYNTYKTDYNFNKICDFNLDSAVNMADVIIMARHFNAVSNEYGEEKVSYVAPDKPEAPRNLKALWYTGSAVSLKWDAPSTKTSISGYEVYINDKVVATEKNTSVICAGLNPGKENTVYVKTVNSSNIKSDASNILRITAPIDDHGDTIDKATPIECEKEIIATMEFGDPVDYFRFTPQTSGTYVFKMYVGFIMKEYLYDSRGVKIGDITDRQFKLEAGKEYFIGAENECISGEYRFVIRPVKNKPDLVIEKINVSKLSVNEQSLLGVRIKNIGDATSRGPFRISFDIDDHKNAFWVDYNKNLEPDSFDTCFVTGSSNGTLTWSSSMVGHHKITVNLDVNNNIDEIYENNNSVTYDVVIDDHPNTKEYAEEIYIGDEISGYIGQKTEKDYFYVIPKSTGTYRIDMPNSKYTNFFIYNKNMTQVVPTGAIYDGNNRIGCFAEAKLTANEKYYIVVSSAPDVNDFMSEVYILTIKQIK